MEYITRAKQFLSDARQELTKVIWSTRQHTLASTWVVLGVVFVVALFLGFVDLLLARFVRYILS